MRYLPGVHYAALPKAGGQVAPTALTSPLWIIVHDTGNDSSSAAGEANFAATRVDSRSNWTSAHFYVDESGVLGSLPLDLCAWAAFAWANGHAIHIELCRRNGRVPDGIRRTGAALVRQLCLQFGVPMVHRSGSYIASVAPGAGAGGVAGHADVTAAHIDRNNHTDPGFGPADWAAFMALVTSTDTTTEAGDMGQQVLVRFTDAADPGQVWLADGILRRRVPAATVVAVGNGQTHQAAFLGLLGNGGAVYPSNGDPDVWGIDVASLGGGSGGGTPLTAAEVEEAAFRAAQRAEGS